MEGKSNIISIVVVTRNKDYLKTCLDSIRNQSYPEIDTIVIDNSLNKDLASEIKRIYPEVNLYSSPSNLFYCKALNKGIKEANGDFILCLNDDVVLDKRFIEEALRGFSINRKIGMVSGKILRPDGITIDSTGLFLTLWLAPRERGYGIKDRGQFEKEEYIFGVNGAVAFYRREMLENIKFDSDYFDADYGGFYEDLDIAWHGQNLGWKAYYIPQAVAYHIRGGTARLSGGIDKPYARRYLSDELNLDLLKNRYLTIIKNESYLSFFIHLPFIILYDFIIWGYTLFFRPYLLKDFFSKLSYFKSALKKRKLLRKMPFKVNSR